MTDFGGKEYLVSDVDWKSWDKHWPKKNDKFESFLCLHSELKELSNKFLFIWDRNHHHQAWTKFISQSHANDLN